MKVDSGYRGPPRCRDITEAWDRAELPGVSSWPKTFPLCELEGLSYLLSEGNQVPAAGIAREARKTRAAWYLAPAVK